jgi:hypothetical protein
MGNLEHAWQPRVLGIQAGNSDGSLRGGKALALLATTVMVKRMDIVAYAGSINTEACLQAGC